MTDSSTHNLFPIQVRELCLLHENRLLLDHVSCTITDKGITAIMGPNGAGKSLFMRFLHGIFSPEDPSLISFSGQPLDVHIQKRQSMVFQTPTLLRRTVFQNMAFIADLRGIKDHRLIHERLAEVGLTDLQDQPALKLSGGEKQRLALARALLTQPDILLLDEACANLDNASTRQIENIIQHVSTKQTKIILVTHDIAQSKRLADDVLFFNQGRICEHSLAKDFFSKPITSEGQLYLQGHLID